MGTPIGRNKGENDKFYSELQAKQERLAEEKASRESYDSFTKNVEAKDSRATASRRSELYNRIVNDLQYKGWDSLDAGAEASKILEEMDSNKEFYGWTDYKEEQEIYHLLETKYQKKGMTR